MKTIEKIINIAKKLKKEAPNKFAKWTDYVKEASKQIKTKSKPIIKKTKKVAKKVTKKIIGSVNKTYLISYIDVDGYEQKRKVSSEELKLITPIINYTILKEYTKKSNKKKIGESHKDTNSHNVKLSIYSGTGLTNKEKSLGYIKPTRSSILKELEGAKAHLNHLTAMYKDKSYTKHKAKIKRSINKQNKHIGNILETL